MKFHSVIAALLISLTSPVFAAVINPPPIEATAYILIDASTGKVIAEKNADAQVPPASLTKMMTDYIVASELKNGAIKADDKVHISEKAWAMQGSKMFVEINSFINLMDLVRGMIIQSGNDATIALAEHVAGSEEAFTDKMNHAAKELGMSNTSFRNATGWPDPNHYTTTRDLAILGRAMVNQTPEQYSLYSEKEFIWHNIKQTNRNLLLWRDPTVDGIKTGHTEEAGYCLVASAKRGDTRLISVVMGAASEEARATESQKLLNYGFSNFQTQKIYDAGKVLQQARVWRGASKQVDIGLKDALLVTIPRGKQDKLQAEVAVDKIIEAPVADRETLGNLVITLDGEQILSQPVVAMMAIDEGGFFTRIWDGIRLFFLKLFGGI